MEERDIQYTLVDLNKNIGMPQRCEGDIGIMDAYTSTDHRKRQQVWEWANTHNIAMLSDTIQNDFIVRQGIWDSPAHKSLVYNNIFKHINTLGAWHTTQTYKRFIPGIHVQHEQGHYGTVTGTEGTRLLIKTK